MDITPHHSRHTKTPYYHNPLRCWCHVDTKGNKRVREQERLGGRSNRASVYVTIRLSSDAMALFVVFGR